jgi:hypothetical protein
MDAQHFAIALSIPASASTLRIAPAPTLVLRRRPAGTQPPIQDEHAECANAVLEAKLLAILDSPIASIETPTQGFDRKERAIGDTFSELGARDGAALLARLTINFPSDVVARKFNKLTLERRERLLNFLRLVCD